MVESHNYGKINIYRKLDHGMQIILTEINRIKDCFMAKVFERKTMSKALTKFNTVFNWFDKTLLVLSTATISVYIASIGSGIDTPVRLKCKGFC